MTVQGDQHKPEFAALNPNERMPVLEDDGFMLWESNAILHYLASKKPGSGRSPPGRRRWFRCHREPRRAPARVVCEPGAPVDSAPRWHRVDPGTRIRLDEIDPGDTGSHTDEAAARATLARDIERLARLQDRLYAGQHHAVLVVLQGLDAAGKHGTVTSRWRRRSSARCANSGSAIRRRPFLALASVGSARDAARAH